MTITGAVGREMHRVHAAMVAASQRPARADTQAEREARQPRIQTREAVLAETLGTVLGFTEPRERARRPAWPET